MLTRPNATGGTTERGVGYRRKLLLLRDKTGIEAPISRSKGAERRGAVYFGLGLLRFQREVDCKGAWVVYEAPGVMGGGGRAGRMSSL